MDFANKLLLRNIIQLDPFKEMQCKKSMDLYVQDGYGILLFEKVKLVQALATGCFQPLILLYVLIKYFKQGKRKRKRKEIESLDKTK